MPPIPIPTKKRSIPCHKRYHCCCRKKPENNVVQSAESRINYSNMIHSQSQRFHHHSSIYFHQRNVQFRVEDETLILNEVRRFQRAVNFNAELSTDDETFIMNEFVLTGRDGDPIRSNGLKLSEETISRRLKTRAYRRALSGQIQDSAADSCVVCQTEYADGETLGTLECGHDYHAVCLRKWLRQKNACPLCRRPAIHQ